MFYLMTYFMSTYCISHKIFKRFVGFCFVLVRDRVMGSTNPYSQAKRLISLMLVNWPWWIWLLRHNSVGNIRVIREMQATIAFRNIMMRGLLPKVEDRHLAKNYEQAFILPNPPINSLLQLTVSGLSNVRKTRSHSSAVYGPHISLCVQQNYFPTSEEPFIW